MVKLTHRYQRLRSSTSSEVLFFIKKYNSLLPGCTATTKKELAEYIWKHYRYLLPDEQKKDLSFRPVKINNHGLSFFNKLFVTGLEKFLLQFKPGK